MRANEFLTEKEDLSAVPDLQKEIVNQVKKVQDFDILDRIYQVLSHQSNKGKIKKAFGAGLKDANIGSVETVINDMMNQVANLSGTTKQKVDFIEALEAGKAVNIAALLKPTSTFDEIFHSKFAQDFFVSIANYGRGASLKGPGEFGLAIMSPKIALADKGDLVVGKRHVEVKAAVNKSGGRLGEPVHAANREEIISTIAKVGKKYLKGQAEIKMLDKFLDRKSISLTKAVQAMHMMFNGNKTAIKAVVSAVVSLTLGPQIGNAVGTAAARDESGIAAELAYMKGNFEWYKKKDKFNEVLAIWFGGAKTYSFSTGAEFLALREAGNIGASSISFIPSKPHEVFAQINYRS